MCRPQGSIELEVTSEPAFTRASGPEVLMAVASGAHYFRLERSPERTLRFYHSTPGTGTRVAEIALGDLPDFTEAYLAFTWSPEGIHLYCGPRGVPNASLMSAKGVKSEMQFRVGRDGNVYCFGAPGGELLSVRLRHAGQLVVAATAIEAWNSTLKAIQVLWTGESPEAVAFEVVQANLTLSMLVTGLESFARTRLLEVEDEGIRPDYERVFRAFASRAERDCNRFAELQAEAQSRGGSILEAVVDAVHVTFQNYDHVKRVYKAAYGIKAADLALSGQTLSNLQRFIHHRHRVLHVSPLLGMLNEEKVPPQEPVFANHATAESAVACFSEYVEALNNATQRLRSM